MVISIYVQGGEQSAVTYYRFMQYFNCMNHNVRYQKMFPDGIYKRYMPIGEKNILLKVALYLYSLLSVFVCLIEDFAYRPDYLIISRTIIKRRIPKVYKFLINMLLWRGTILIWDFDDDIVELKEINSKDFSYLSRKASKIVIASPYLNEIISIEYKYKSVFIPTTDGSMLELMKPNFSVERESAYEEEIRLLWVGTSSSLKYLESICHLLDDAAEYVKKRGKKMVLTVVCNAPLKLETIFLSIKNYSWTREIAQSQFFCSHIGLMPLDNSLVTKRKGGFKLIQYLSVGLPVVVSTIGINGEILKEPVGYGIDSLDSIEWKNSIIKLGLDIEMWRKYSLKAKEIYNRDFSFYVNLHKWEEVLSL